MLELLSDDSFLTISLPFSPQLPASTLYLLPSPFTPLPFLVTLDEWFLSLLGFRILLRI